MPPDALPANASEIVPVGAIDSRCELRMPCARICAFSSSGRREAQCGSARNLSASKSGKMPFSRALSAEAAYAASRIVRLMSAASARAEHRQGVAEAGEAQPDASLVRRFLRLFRQWPQRGVEHVVQRTDRHASDFAEPVPVEGRPLAERVDDEARQVDRAEAA